MLSQERSMPEVVRDLPRIRSEHARLGAMLASGPMDAGDAVALAAFDDEMSRFDAMCMRTPAFRLYATGIMPGDELSHPMSAITGRAVTRSMIEIDGEAMTLMEATRRIAATTTGRGPALGEWTARGIRIGDAMGLWPMMGTAADAAQNDETRIVDASSSTDGATDLPAPPVAESPDDRTQAAPVQAPPAKPVNLAFDF